MRNLSIFRRRIVDQNSEAPVRGQSKSEAVCTPHCLTPKEIAVRDALGCMVDTRGSYRIPRGLVVIGRAPRRERVPGGLTAASAWGQTSTQCPQVRTFIAIVPRQ